MTSALLYRSRMAVSTLVLALCALISIGARASAQSCDPTKLAMSPTGVADMVRGTPPAFDWEGAYLETQVCYPSRQSGAQLAGYLLAPIDIASGSELLPVVVIGPGSGTGRAYNYLWSARELASHGYLALVSDPQGSGSSQIVGDLNRCGPAGCPGVPWQQASNYVDNLESATDFIFTKSHPWLARADLDHVGMAGHSLSARTSCFVQGIDNRIKAVVAWDNMSSTLEGDAGVASGGGTCGQLIGGELPGPSQPVTPSIAVLGEASDSSPSCMPTDKDSDVKKTGYLFWKAANLSTMEVVFKGASHLNWAQTSSSNPAQLRLFEYYTRAWFDRFLLNDSTADLRLLSPMPLGQPVGSVLSSQFNSAAFFDGHDCEQFQLACQ